MSVTPGQDMKILDGFLRTQRQKDLVAEVRKVVAAAPFYQPRMPRTGQPFSVQMTCAGKVGWVSDKSGGYRYQKTHPVTGAPWPEIPSDLLEIWSETTGSETLPDCCLVNFYPDSKAKMGLHQDRDERDLEAPVVSISLGDEARFRIGTSERRGPTRSFKLLSGDIVVLTGASRLAFHGIDRVYPRTSTLLKQGGRLNLTLRQAL